MIVLPIVDRELRVAARRVATYRTRLWAAVAAMALAVWQCLDLAWTGASASTQGRWLFYTLASLAFVYSLVIGARVTSDCLSEEKREGTLGLLFLTDLKGMDVVLGKLVANSLNSFYGLLSVLPLLAMPLLLGGVTLAQFGRMVLVLVNALFFSLSVGIFVSSISRNERKAMFGTLLGVMAPAMIPFCVLFFMMAVLDKLQTSADLGPALPWLMANPVYPFVLSLPWATMTGLPIPSWTFWASLVFVHCCGWGLLLVTAVILPRVWSDQARTECVGTAPTLAQRWNLWTQGDHAGRQAFRTRLLRRNPFFWLISRDRLKPGYVWCFLASMIGVWLWGYAQHREVMFDFNPLVPTLMLVHCFLKVWVVSEVSHRWVEDQRNGALELLLTTPLTLEDIRHGQQLALWRQFSRPMLVLCAVELAVFQSTYALPIILAFVMMLIADMATLMWVAMRLSLTARSINEVLLKSLLWVLVVPTVIYIVCWPLWTALLRELNWSLWRLGFRHKVYFWFLVGILNNTALVLIWARPDFLARARHNCRRWWAAVTQAVQKGAAWRLKLE